MTTPEYPSTLGTTRSCGPADLRIGRALLGADTTGRAVVLTLVHPAVAAGAGSGAVHRRSPRRRGCPVVVRGGRRGRRRRGRSAVAGGGPRRRAPRCSTSSTSAARWGTRAPPRWPSGWRPGSPLCTPAAPRTATSRRPRSSSREEARGWSGSALASAAGPGYGTPGYEAPEAATTGPGGGFGVRAQRRAGRFCRAEAAWRRALAQAMWSPAAAVQAAGRPVRSSGAGRAVSRAAGCRAGPTSAAVQAAGRAPRATCSPWVPCSRSRPQGARRSRRDRRPTPCGGPRKPSPTSRAWPSPCGRRCSPASRRTRPGGPPRRRSVACWPRPRTSPPRGCAAAGPPEQPAPSSGCRPRVPERPADPSRGRLVALLAVAAVVLVGAVAAVVTLTGRTGGGAPTAAGPAATLVPIAPAPTAAPASSTLDAGTGATLVDLAPFGADAPRFTTPSRNISCGLTDTSPTGDGDARCEVTQSSWPLPPKPADCAGVLGRRRVGVRRRQGPAHLRRRHRGRPRAARPRPTARPCLSAASSATARRPACAASTARPGTGSGWPAPPTTCSEPARSSGSPSS